ncbi:helix-turn-helix domain-containing protein [Pseudomonas sp. DTU_2021_1001937_2_SI_NGA_ILE_001]|uniref:helix-turn-helix domain-containing protein n=1 Tax=Pseudomonas sp. DTU_2021_1001937_2_SI_NGA_ILE_001 TaxID=3077589 RepID=UPI0028FC1698|nr:helix-turn-helix domain-containing protein [Pseudomonas sp. DTU_2021_1001937_2_SI_NGA_ILE_001]WNW12419.1 helix-turn-helix domain-containing protein [Pseudomonas sp. DTU_2021_1001937_2_SI_NGA_ILE_001]
MKIDIGSTAELGAVIRASRKAMKVRQDDAAGLIGVSENFLGKVESGADTVQWGKLLQVLQQLSLAISVEIPEPYGDAVEKILSDAKQGRDKRPRKTRGNTLASSEEAD